MSAGSGRERGEHAPLDGRGEPVRPAEAVQPETEDDVAAGLDSEVAGPTAVASAELGEIPVFFFTSFIQRLKA